MFIDASAFCAILLHEPERDLFQSSILATTATYTSAIAVWETVRGVVKESDREVSIVQGAVEELLASFGTKLIPIGLAEQRLAVEAFARFGKGRHRADLNLGDCFAYACARANGLPLLFKGKDFGQTDIDQVMWRQP